MLRNRYFAAWVANTICSISGIWPEYLCGKDGECVLTSAETRMDACQWPASTSSDLYKRGSMRQAARVTTHKRPAGETLH